MLPRQGRLAKRSQCQQPASARAPEGTPALVPARVGVGMGAHAHGIPAAPARQWVGGRACARAGVQARVRVFVQTHSRLLQTGRDAACMHGSYRLACCLSCCLCASTPTHQSSAGGGGPCFLLIFEIQILVTPTIGPIDDTTIQAHAPANQCSAAEREGRPRSGRPHVSPSAACWRAGACGAAAGRSQSTTPADGRSDLKPP